MNEGNEIGVSKNLKIHIGVGKFFSFNEIDMKNLLFNKTDFNIQLKDIIFLKNYFKQHLMKMKYCLKTVLYFLKIKTMRYYSLTKLMIVVFFMIPIIYKIF